MIYLKEEMGSEEMMWEEEMFKGKKCIPNKSDIILCRPLCDANFLCPFPPLFLGVV